MQILEESGKAEAIELSNRFLRVLYVDRLACQLLTLLI
jgi:hypothetical protein